MTLYLLLWLFHLPIGLEKTTSKCSGLKQPAFHFLTHESMSEMGFSWVVLHVISFGTLDMESLN
jgi:hypothetical protein